MENLYMPEQAYESYENKHQIDFGNQFESTPDMREWLERATQTTVLVTRSQSTNREQGTQAVSITSHFSSCDDKTVKARDSYVTADQVYSMRCKAVVVIQSFIRGKKARHRYRGLKNDRMAEVNRIEVERGAESNRENESLKFGLDRRINPKTVYDLDLLKCELRDWIATETTALRDELGSVPTPKQDPRYRAGMKRILAESIKLREKIKIKRSASVSYRPAFLVSKWGVTQIESEVKRRLFEIYNELQVEPPKSHAVRVSLLEDAKIALDGNHEELACLIEREQILLCSKRAFRSMPGLRLRILNKFREFMNTA
jgi:hypothetical protein